MIGIEDWAQINEAIARYCWAVDAGDGETFAGLWTADGELSGIAPQPLKGPEALAGMATGVGPTGMRHLYSNLICEYAGAAKDRVNARFYNYVSAYEPGSGVIGMAVCHAEFVRQDGAWKLKSNHVDIKPPKQG